MGRRKKWAGAGVELPIGSFIIRKGRRSPQRYIKVQMTGTQRERWRAYSRVLWERHHGPIPEGMRVIHKDGDSLHDKIGNLILGTADDVLMFIRDWDPELDNRNRRNVAEATARSNAERAACRRLREWLPASWYAVDHDRRLIVNVPNRTRARIWPPEISSKVRSNGGGADQSALGYPNLAFSQALLLTAMIESPEADRRQLMEAVARRGHRHWPGYGDWQVQTFASTLCALRRLGLVSRHCKRRQRYRVLEAALASRGPTSPYVPVRGSELDGEGFMGYLRWTPGVNDRDAKGVAG